MTPLRRAHLGAALLMLSAGLVAFLPVRTLKAPEGEAEAEAEAQVNSEAPSFQSLTRYFDRTGLPAPKPAPDVQTAEAAPPPPDPAERLSGYRYLGMANSDGRMAAIFEKSGGTRILKPNERLEDFALVDFDENSAVFENEGQKVPLYFNPD